MTIRELEKIYDEVDFNMVGFSFAHICELIESEILIDGKEDLYLRFDIEHIKFAGPYEGTVNFYNSVITVWADTIKSPANPKRIAAIPLISANMEKAKELADIMKESISHGIKLKRNIRESGL